MQLTIHVDGGSRGNPGPAAAGISIVRSVDGVAVHEAGYFLGHKTNNVAEYEAMLRALAVATDLGADEVDVMCDSELVVKQLLGEYRVKSEDLKPLHEQVQMKLLRFDRWQIRHVRREKNKRADQLVNMSLDAGETVVAVDSGKGEVDCVPSASPRKAPASRGASGKKASSKGGGNDPTPGRCPASFSATIVNGDEGHCAVERGGDGSAHFGPGTPRDFCIYAARAALMATPIDDPVRLRNLRQIETSCPQCGAVVRISPQTP